MVNPFLTFISEFEITHELLSSLPAALNVKITPTGRESIGFSS